MRCTRKVSCKHSINLVCELWSSIAGELWSWVLGYLWVVNVTCYQFMCVVSGWCPLDGLIEAFFILCCHCIGSTTVHVPLRRRWLSCPFTATHVLSLWALMRGGWICLALIEVSLHEYTAFSGVWCYQVASEQVISRDSHCCQVWYLPCHHIVVFSAI